MGSNLGKQIAANIFSKLIYWFIVGVFVVTIIYIVIDYISSDAVNKYTDMSKLLTKSQIVSTKSQFKQAFLESTNKKADIYTSTRREENDNSMVESVGAFDTNTFTVSYNSEWVWPVPGFTEITSRFGAREQVAGTNINTTNHGGLDISGSNIFGTPILAVADGVVEKAAVLNSETADKYSAAYGNYIELKHLNGVETVYAHCERLNVSVGDIVKQGDVIAYVGNTGQSSGAHLHIAVKVNGVLKDPELYLIIPQ